jgi:cyclopropane fatty-acyl-phospholipid synthase-like methyltransferase
MTVNQYGRLWDAYWKDLPDRAGEAFWDCAPADGAAVHVELFRPHLDPGLPLVDLGCGNGTQARYLAEVFGRVVGADISAAALARARRENPHPGLEYRLLDVLDAGQVAAFRAEFGDVNVYVSGVIHQLSAADRARCARSLAVLAGARGCVFNQELTPESYAFMQELIHTGGDRLRKLERVSTYFRIGLQPRAGESALESVFTAAGFRVLESGRLSLRTTETMADGSRLELPTSYVIVRPDRGADGA